MSLKASIDVFDLWQTHLLRCTSFWFLLFLCVCEAALHEIEKEPAYWNAQAKAALNAALKLHPRHHRAKNLILFLGDGRCKHFDDKN